MAKKPSRTKIDVFSVSDEIADAIRQLAEVGEALQRSPLKQKAQVLLLQDITKLPRTDITYVLNALPHLKDYIK